MLPSAQGARAHMDLGLGWGMVTQLPPSTRRALLTPILSHSKAPLCPAQGTWQLGPGVPRANKGLWVGETAREPGDQSWHLEGSMGPSRYCSTPEPQPLLPRRPVPNPAGSGRLSRLPVLWGTPAQLQFTHRQSHLSAGFTAMPLHWLFHPLLPSHAASSSCRPLTRLGSSWEHRLSTQKYQGDTA